MAEPRLPIDVVPGTVPPRFRWHYHPTGMMPVQCEGIMVVSIEAALVDLIDLCKRQRAEIHSLKERVARLTSGGQVEAAQEPVIPQPAQHREHRRGKK